MEERRRKNVICCFGLSRSETKRQSEHSEKKIMLRNMYRSCNFFLTEKTHCCDLRNTVENMRIPYQICFSSPPPFLHPSLFPKAGCSLLLLLLLLWRFCFSHPSFLSPPLSLLLRNEDKWLLRAPSSHGKKKRQKGKGGGGKVGSRLKKYRYIRPLPLFSHKLGSPGFADFAPF